MLQKLPPQKFYFLIGYSETILSYFYKCPIKLEIQTLQDKAVYKYLWLIGVDVNTRVSSKDNTPQDCLVLVFVPAHWLISPKCTFFLFSITFLPHLFCINSVNERKYNHMCHWNITPEIITLKMWWSYCFTIKDHSWEEKLKFVYWLKQTNIFAKADVSNQHHKICNLSYLCSEILGGILC